MYSTVNLVREYSGMRNATNISSSNIKGKILRADSMINGYLRRRYKLPLLYHRSVDLTFAGTGASSATLTITINSVDYDLSITNGASAESIADLLRVALEGNTSVAFDEIGSGEVVRLTSLATNQDLSTANDQVTVVTSDAGGVTSSVSLAINRYPQLIEGLSAELAASFLLMDNYGLEEQGTSRDGVARMEQAKIILRQIQGVDSLEESIRVEDDITGLELPTATSPEPRVYPNATSDASTPSTEPTFGVNMIF